MAANKKQAETCKEKGNKLFQEGKFEEACRAYTDAIKLDGQNHVYFSNRSASFAGLGQWAQALEDANQCVRLNSRWGKGYYRKALALLGLSRPEEALKVLREGQGVDPSNGDIKAKIAEVQQQAERAKKFVGTDGSALTGAALAKAEGNDLFKQSKYEEAAACYTRALAATQDKKERSVLLSNRAACWSQYQNWQRMLEDCNASLTEDPVNVKALIRRGLAYEGLEKYQLAINDMKQVLSLDPGAVLASSAISRLSRCVQSR